MPIPYSILTRSLQTGASLKSEMAEVERLNEEIRVLVRERQELRERGAGRDDLERNRRKIVGCQWQLTRALGEAYSPKLAARAA
jgi:hypothetical protein